MDKQKGQKQLQTKNSIRINPTSDQAKPFAIKTSHFGISTPLDDLVTGFFPTFISLFPIMKKHHFIFLYFLTMSISLFGQTEHLQTTYTDIVFVDSTNVRDSPSIDGKIIGKINHNTTIQQCLSSESVKGKVGAVEDYWLPIVFQGQNGYIWRPNLADGVFKSELDLDVRFLLNFTQNKGLEFKVFRNKELINTGFFEFKKHREMYGSTSFGTTFNSNGKEIIAVGLDSIYHLFEWNGSVIKASNIKLQDDSFMTGKYFSFNEVYINSDQVNVRNAPKVTATAIESLNKFTKVELVKEKPVFDEINEIPGYWYAIKRNGKKGYVWSRFIDVPKRYVKSNKVENESFLYTNNAIYVFKDSEMKCRFPIDFFSYYESDEQGEMYKNDFIQFGNRGLNSNYQFLGICYSANACGEAGGDQLYLWDGTKMIYFANDYSVGDGGYSENHEYIFPNETEGVKDKVIHETSYEYYGGDATNCTEPPVCLFTYYYHELQFNGDTLVEVETRDSKLRAFLADSLQVFQFNHAKFSDLNNDGFTDAVFLMDERRDENDDYDAPIKTIVGVAYGTSTGEFNSLVTNENLVLQDYFTVAFNVRNDTLEIRVNYDIDEYRDESKIPKYSEFTFVHDPSYNKLVWYSKIEAEAVDPESHDLVWNITNSEKFRKNKVSFKNAWESNKSR